VAPPGGKRRQERTDFNAITSEYNSSNNFSEYLFTYQMIDCDWAAIRRQKSTEDAGDIFACHKGCRYACILHHTCMIPGNGNCFEWTPASLKDYNITQLNTFDITKSEYHMPSYQYLSSIFLISKILRPTLKVDKNIYLSSLSYILRCVCFLYSDHILRIMLSHRIHII